MTKINIYLISRGDTWDYDEYDAFVVRAWSETEARTLCYEVTTSSFNLKNYSPEFLDPDKSTCTLIGTSDETSTKIILGSFNAG